MRIVAGKFRRRKLHTNPGLTTRPLTDRVKETLFERLGDEIEFKKIADLFAGTGTFGLEALSRGAQSVVFIEQDRRAHDLLKQNVEMLGVEDQTLCWKTDVLRSSFRPKGVPHLVPFDVVFVDPPYRMIPNLKQDSLLYKSLERLARDDVSSRNALLLLRTPIRSEFECPSVWERERTLDFKTMKIHLFRKQVSSDKMVVEKSES